MTTLDSWTAAVCTEFGIDSVSVDVRRILDLARDLAHQVNRPAAPVTAFRPGLAIGAGIPADDAMGRVRALTENWEAEAAGPRRDAGWQRHPGISDKSPRRALAGQPVGASDPEYQGW